MANWDSTLDYNQSDLQTTILRKILGALKWGFVNLIASSSGSAVSSIVTGSDVVVAAAGTAVQVPAQDATRGVLIEGRLTNTGNIYIGDSTVTNKTGTKRGVVLVPGGTYFFPVSNANLLYVNADTNNDAATVTAL